MFGRLVDAGLRASLLLRGKVAAGLAAAAEITYREHLEADRFTYYGRVFREGGYVCLQYWFFYAMNDWRSTFAGINDHEADWEMVTVYLAEGPTARRAGVGRLLRRTTYEGDDLRRRWDDPDLPREGDHPVVFAGRRLALRRLRLRRLRDLGRSAPASAADPGPSAARQRLLAAWRRGANAHSSGFGIPFVDYARGDGGAIGPGRSGSGRRC